MLAEEANELEKELNCKELIIMPKEGKFFGELLEAENGECPLLGEKGCIHPELKPLDCQIYPYNVMKDGESYFLIRHYDNCPKHIIFEDKNIDTIINMLFPYYKEYAETKEELAYFDYVVCKKIT